MSDELMSTAEIARMVSASRATVSNWKQRFEDFPTPAEYTHEGHPLYRPADVRTFVARHGLPNSSYSRKHRVITTCQVDKCGVPAQWAATGYTTGAIKNALHGFKMCDAHLLRRDLGYVVVKARQLVEEAA